MCTQGRSASQPSALRVGYSRVAWGREGGDWGAQPLLRGDFPICPGTRLNLAVRSLPSSTHFQCFNVLYSASNSGGVNKKIIFVKKKKKKSLNKRWNFRKSSSTLVNSEGEAMKRKQVTWRELRCGGAPRMPGTPAPGHQHAGSPPSAFGAPRTHAPCSSALELRRTTRGSRGCRKKCPRGGESTRVRGCDVASFLAPPPRHLRERRALRRTCTCERQTRAAGPRPPREACSDPGSAAGGAAGEGEPARAGSLYFSH